MSKKNLARTIIEGGRSQPYRDFRKQAIRAERQRDRAYCDLFKECVLDEDFVELESEFKSNKLQRIPMAWGYSKSSNFERFRDKLSAIDRWLYSHVGEAWDTINALARMRFDQRTISGQHILFDHLLASVEKPSDRNYLIDYNDSFRAFYVDLDGTLQLTRRGRERLFLNQGAPKPPKVKKPPSWREKSLVIDYGNVQFWTEELKISGSMMCMRINCAYTCGLRIGNNVICRKYLHLRQCDQLQPEESAYWRTLSQYVQKDKRYNL